MQKIKVKKEDGILVLLKPKEVKEKYICDTLYSILVNYKEQQDKLFEALLKLFQEKPSASFDNAVKNSAIYKEQQNIPLIRPKRRCRFH